MPHRPTDRPPVPSRVFSAAEVAALGYTQATVRHALHTGQWERLRRGVYRLPADSPVSTFHRRELDLAEIGLGAQRACRGAALSHCAAAVLLDLPTYRAPHRPCVTVPAGSAMRRLRGAHLHRAMLEPEQLRTVSGIAVTSPERTILDIAREVGVDSAVVTADAGLRLGVVTHQSLAQAFDAQSGWPGRAAARAAIAHARPEAESPLESLSRLAVADAGLPAPTLQQEIGDGRGGFLARVDFYWDEFGVIGESDGEVKYQAVSDVLAEKRRETLLAELGLVVVRWTWGDLACFSAVERRLQAAFRRGAQRGSARGWSLIGS
jgi:hypothetical protein